MTEHIWRPGDTVRHPAKPEWGPGTVVSALSTTQDGKPCQRLNVRFGRAGLKTISTAFAALEPADSPANPAAPQRASSWLDEAERLPPAERMSRLPDSVTDPFRTLLQRFKSALDLYTYQPSGGSLIDWATTQSGLTDPLAEFSRHDLEAFFQRFRNNLDQHLRKLAPELAKADREAVRALAAGAPSAAVPVLRRLNIGR
jgi:hypothetical protein